LAGGSVGGAYRHSSDWRLPEDGLGDAADGLIGGRDRDDALAVMRDSRLGTLLAIVTSVLLRSAACADGLGVETGRPSVSVATAAVTIGVLISRTALGPIRGAIVLGAPSAAVFTSGMLAQRRIGGYTGDVLGAFQQIGEIVVLLTAAAR
jgi:adenosylcobinamide-GDP ribazoletransferase